MQIRILALLLFFQSFAACQQDQEKTLSLAAGIVAPSATGRQENSEKNRSSSAAVVFQSTDGGQTWQDISAGLPKKLSARWIFANGDEVLLGTERGFYRSNSTSVTPVWEKDFFSTEEITNISPGRSGLYFCSYQNGFFQEIPGTGIWGPIHTTLKEKGVRTILETPGGTLFVGSDSGIFKSADGGQTWKQVFDKGLVLNIVTAGDVLIADGMEGVLRSTDGGEHWDVVLDENILVKKVGLLKDQFVAILGTKDPTKVSPEGITNRLRVSPDGGKSWQRMEKVPLPIGGMYNMDIRLSQVRDVYDIVQVGEYLLCSFDTGIFRSSDKGKTWEPVFASDGERVFNLTVSGKVIYALKVFGGC
ncbi:MAG: exo-alpha-sialidase [Lewinellaceae bacterium]|nr:exo-alpha-sialidase [Lewinellaceae bacterium]